LKRWEIKTWSGIFQNGGFYSAEDADSFPTEDAKDKKEGAFCVWTHEEIQKALNQKVSGQDNLTFADIFCEHFGVASGGNVNPAQVRNHLRLQKKSNFINSEIFTFSGPKACYLSVTSR
jgi:uncharacterized protein YyaL (SSP411 family)